MDDRWNRSNWGDAVALCHSKADRKQWLALRQHGWGASDAGKLCGLVPYITDPAKHREQTILAKAFPKAAPADKESPAMWVGNMLEDKLIDRWHERTKHYARVDDWSQMLAIPELPWLYVTPDYGGYVAGSNLRYPIEAKVVDPEVHKKYWKPDNTPPKHVIAQAVLQGWMVRAPAVTVVQWHWGAWPKDYTVEVKQSTVSWLLTRLEAAWREVEALRYEAGIVIENAAAAGLGAAELSYEHGLWMGLPGDVTVHACRMPDHAGDES
jgi:hypothetical protein